MSHWKKRIGNLFIVVKEEGWTKPRQIKLKDLFISDKIFEIIEEELNDSYVRGKKSEAINQAGSRICNECSKKGPDNPIWWRGYDEGLSVGLNKAIELMEFDFIHDYEKRITTWHEKMQELLTTLNK